MRLRCNFLSMMLGVCATVMLSACATKATKDETTQGYRGRSAKTIYMNAKHDMARGRYGRAVKALEAMEVLYPYGAYAQQGKLDLITAYYKNNDSASAVASSEHFIRLYPRSKNIDYAYYMRALANFRQNRSFLTRKIARDPSKRDLTLQRQSFSHFKEMIARFPHSAYVPEALRHMVLLRDILARSELHIARYYFERGAYVAAANRAGYLVDHYQQSPDVPAALVLMVKSYRELGLDLKAQETLRVIGANYPSAMAALTPQPKRHAKPSHHAKKAHR